MNATMIRLERNEAMRRACERCKAHHPKVTIINAAQRLYRVAGSKGAAYTVRLAVANGHKLAACDCQAGQSGQLCYHVAAAAAVNIGIAAQRAREQRERANAVLVKPQPKGPQYNGIDI